MVTKKIKGGIHISLNEAIILILAKSFPLRIKEVHNKLGKEFFIEVTFQAVRKALITLSDKDVLLKIRSEYQLNKKWIAIHKQLSDQMIQTYYRAERNDRPPRSHLLGGVQVFELDNPLQADKFLGELLLDIASYEGKKTLYIQAPHYWYFLGHLGTESDFIQEMNRKGTTLYYVSFGKESVLDKLAKQFYKQHYVAFVSVHGEFDQTIELCAIKDFVIRVEYTKQFIAALENFFSTTRDLGAIDFLEFGKLIKSKQPVTLTVTKDPSLATAMQERGLRYF